jgi:tetratricopeptide (TPR) repeat protein
MPAARLRPTTTAVVALALAGALFATGQEARAAALDDGQRQTLLAEANDTYATAVGIAAKDSAEAKQGFSDAAAKYQLVVDAGIQNSQLYFNLGNAYLQSGQTGRAIANYRRTLRLDPTNQNARTNLAYAESLLKKSESATAIPQGSTYSELAIVANGWLNRFVSPAAVLTIAIVSWIGFWAAIGLRLCDVRVPWKTLAACALIVCAVAATSYAASCQSAARSEAIVISSDMALRTGDGKNFSTVAGATLNEGQQIEWLKRRGDWVQVRTAQGQTGWMPDAAIELL